MSGAEPLCTQERETIFRGLSRESSIRCIGKLLGRHHKVVSGVDQCETGRGVS
jgi:IS30 family transposase